MDSFWEKIAWGNTTKDYGIAMAIIVVSLLALRLVKTVGHWWHRY